jgi:pimeloyl-ACP methyl ester carboxylesterase
VSLEEQGGFKLHSDPDSAFLPRNYPTQAFDANAHYPDFIRIGGAPITALYKPLWTVCLMFVVRQYARSQMRSLGFSEEEDVDTNIVFWVRPPRPRKIHNRGEPRRPPLFFLHGVGMGILPYIRFIDELSRDSNRWVVAPELPNASRVEYGIMGLHKMCRTDEYAQAIRAQLERIAACEQELGEGATSTPRSNDRPPPPPLRADFIGHSFGSAAINFIAREQPALVGRRVYIDPVVFAPSFHEFITFTNEPSLLSLGSIYKSCSGSLLYFFRELWIVRGDMDVQLLLKRTAFLFEMLFFDVDIDAGSVAGQHETHTEPCRDCRGADGSAPRPNDGTGREGIGASMVVLSGCDDMVASEDITAFLHSQHPSVDIAHDPDWIHGGFLFQEDPHQIWQRIYDHVYPPVNGVDGGSASATASSPGVMRRVASSPSFRGSLVQLGNIDGKMHSNTGHKPRVLGTRARAIDRSSE